MIECDQHEYTLDDEDRRVQTVILKRDPSQHDTVVLKKSLSCSYPNMPIKEAIKKENEKLHLELQQSQANYDISQCEVIQHLLDVTEVVAATSLPEKSSPVKESNVEQFYIDADSHKGDHDKSYTKSSDKKITSRWISSISSFPCFQIKKTLSCDYLVPLAESRTK